ncbi:hypothetical protein BD289DRAFT_447993 [Coniella lustricola]|uniref:Uncharacterized protein n=1 Tax=Coniella lustricola TaxID=2025994 RepID=A0A2T2ZSJ2_9PEZI|nr:hypothetical protein BD289DRAFT_447993 [Coniella lustricola]
MTMIGPTGFGLAAAGSSIKMPSQAQGVTRWGLVTCFEIRREKEESQTAAQEETDKEGRQPRTTKAQREEQQQEKGTESRDVTAE